MHNKVKEKNPPCAYLEDINRDGLMDIVIGGVGATGSGKTEIYYNRGNGEYSRSMGDE